MYTATVQNSFSVSINASSLQADLTNTSKEISSNLYLSDAFNVDVVVTLKKKNPNKKSPNQSTQTSLTMEKWHLVWTIFFSSLLIICAHLHICIFQNCQVEKTQHLGSSQLRLAHFPVENPEGRHGIGKGVSTVLF